MTNILTESEMEKILLGDPYVRAIDSPEKWASLNINLSLWSQDRFGANQHVLDTLNNYISLKYIIDNFETDHRGRRKWGMEMKEKYGWFNDYYSSNALKWGKIFQVSFDLQSFSGNGYVGIRPDKFRELREGVLEVIPNNPLEYNGYNTQQKIVLVKKIKSRIYALLTFLSGQSPIITK